MIDITHLLTVLIETGSFISVFAAVAAGFLMASMMKKFGTGILASGFKLHAMGISFIAFGIIIDAANSYIQISNFSLPFFVIMALLIAKATCFLIGTYAIVIGSKRTGDKIESLTK